MNGGPISWKDCWQDYALLSTSEAKFITVSQAGQEAHYLCETLTGDLWYQQMSTTEIFEDNLAYVVMSVNKNLVHRRFFTHIDIGTGRHLNANLSSPLSPILPFVVHEKWWPTPSPRVWLHPRLSPIATSWLGKRLVIWSFCTLADPLRQRSWNLNENFCFEFVFWSIAGYKSTGDMVWCFTVVVMS